MDRELVILVGPPGCGKTHYCRARLPGHVRLSQDEGPRRYEGILRRLAELLAQDEPRIVVDRTNPMRRQRQELAELARRAGYRVRIVCFAVPREVCQRRISGRGDHPTLSADRMNEAINLFQSRFDPPTEQECDALEVVGE